MLHFFRDWSRGMSHPKRLVSLLLLLVAAVVALAACAREPESTPSSEASADQIADGPIAPELTGIAGWINTEPFTWRSLRGDHFIDVLRQPTPFRQHREKRALCPAGVVDFKTPANHYPRVCEGQLPCSVLSRILSSLNRQRSFLIKPLRHVPDWH